MNQDKIKRKLPSLLIDTAADGGNYEYQKKRSQLSQLQRNHPKVFDGFVTNFYIMLDNLDKEAEKAGFMHLDFNSDGELIRKKRSRD